MKWKIFAINLRKKKKSINSKKVDDIFAFVEKPELTTKETRNNNKS